MTALTLSDLAARGDATISVPEAGAVLSLGRDASYAAAARGEIPTLRLGRRLVVPVPRLLELLGATPPTHIADAGPTTEPASEATTSSPKESSHDHGDPQARVASSNVRPLRP